MSKKDLKGFTPIADLAQKVKSSEIKNEKLFSLYDFLEKEELRLKNTNVFFSSKMQTLEEFPQSESILKQQEMELNNLRDKIINQSVDINSEANKYFEYIFNKSLRI